MIHSFSYIAWENDLHPELRFKPGDYIFDCRNLMDPAPFFQGRRGTDLAVIKFVLNTDQDGPKHFDTANEILKSNPETELYFGCAGGIYRSAALAQWVAEVHELEVKHHGLELFESGVHVWNLDGNNV